MAKCLCLLVIALIQVACTIWPRPSTGGYAAHYIFTPAYQKDLAKAPCLFKLSHELGRLLQTTISLKNAARCYPARYLLIHGLANQIAQEIAGGLEHAARTDLKLYEDNLKELIRLNKYKGCRKRHKSRNFDNLQMRLQ